MQGYDTVRLHASLLRPCDEDLFFSLYTDQAIMRFIGPALSAERTARMFRRALRQPRSADGPYLFSLRERITGRSVGISGVVQIDAERKRAEVGIVLKSDAHGQGYGREGLAGIANEALRFFLVDELWVQCSALNPIVERMVTSVGFALVDPGSMAVGPYKQRVWSMRRSA